MWSCSLLRQVHIALCCWWQKQEHKAAYLLCGCSKVVAVMEAHWIRSKIPREVERDRCELDQQSTSNTVGEAGILNIQRSSQPCQAFPTVVNPASEGGKLCQPTAVWPRCRNLKVLPSQTRNPRLRPPARV